MSSELVRYHTGNKTLFIAVLSLWFLVISLGVTIWAQHFLCSFGWDRVSLCSQAGLRLEAILLHQPLPPALPLRAGTAAGHHHTQPLPVCICWIMYQVIIWPTLKKNKWLRKDLRILILSPKRHHCQRALVWEVGFCVLFCFFQTWFWNPISYLLLLWS